MSADTQPRTPFHELSDFVAIPRVAALRLAPDGTWLAAAVQTLSADKKKYLTSIWRIDAQGGPARRLTRSAEGEGSPRFLPDGSLLFTSRRPDPAGKKTGTSDGDSGDVAALWLLPAAGGEPRVVAALPGGVTAAEVARRRRRHRGRRVRCCRPRGTGTAPRTTRGYARSARTPGSPPSCTSPRRSGPGITTSGPISPGCSPSTPTRCRRRRSAGPAGTRNPGWPTTPGWPRKGPNGRRIPPGYGT